jgi:hypothetical protein
MEFSSGKLQLPMEDENLPSCTLKPLREEPVALRALLSLDLERSTFKVDPYLQTLALSAGIKDFLFLAIDVEGLIGGPALPQEY